PQSKPPMASCSLHARQPLPGLPCARFMMTHCKTGKSCNSIPAGTCSCVPAFSRNNDETDAYAPASLLDLRLHEILDDANYAASENLIKRRNKFVNMGPLANERRLKTDHIAIIFGEGHQHAMIAQKMTTDEAG